MYLASYLGFVVPGSLMEIKDFVGKELSEAEYRRMKRESKAPVKYSKKRVGNTTNMDLYMGPWEKHENVPIKSNRNIQKCNTFCKKYYLKMDYKPYTLQTHRYPSTARSMYKFKDKVNFIQYFRRYDLMASASRDGRVAIHQNEIARLFVGHSDEIIGICLSTDERRIASADRSGRVLEWDVERGKCTWDISFAREFTCSAQDGNIFALGGCTSSVLLLDGRTQCVLEHPISDTAKPCSIALRNNDLIICNENGSLYFLDIRNSRTVSKIEDGGYLGLFSGENSESFMALSSYHVDVMEGSAIRGRYPVKDCSSIFQSNNEILYGNIKGEIVYAISGRRIRITDSEITAIARKETGVSEISVGFKDGRIFKCF